MDAVHVVGAGGIGCALGYALRSAGVPVTLVEANPAKVRWGRRHGIAVAGRPALPADFADFAGWVPPADACVLVCTKCYDNAEVLGRLPASVAVVPVQNGFDPRLEARGHALEGIASFVSECDADRPHTRITRPGRLHLGPRGPVTPADERRLADLAAALRPARLFRVEVVTDVRPYKFTKLMYNAAISPLAAAAGIDNGQLLTVPRARRLFFALLRENEAILRAAGVELGKVGPLHPTTVAAILRRPWLARVLARAFAPSLRGTYCSMANDLPRGRTEIAYYNGRLIALAGDRPCPLNRAVVALVERMQTERARPRPEVLNEL